MTTPGDIVLFCGDPHGQFDHILRAAVELRPSAVMLLGNIEPARPLYEELAPIADKLWHIHGNHDTDSERNWSHLWGSKLADRNLDGGDFAQWAPDRRLGGAFRESVWYPTCQRRQSSAIAKNISRPSPAVTADHCRRRRLGL